MDVVVNDSALDTEGEADIVSWLVANGATVRVGQPIAELETAKVVLEVVAPVSGTLQIVVPAGQLIERGTVIARIL